MEKIKDSFEQFNIPMYREIPDIGLYLDQVVKYVNGCFADFPEMNVTASMLTNYVKLKIVSRSGKKTYRRSQIARFIFIAMSKTALSMDNIRIVLGLSGDDFEDSYGKFRDNMLEVLKTLSLESGTLARDGSMLSNICIAIGHKMYLERYFSSIDPPDDKEHNPVP